MAMCAGVQKVSRPIVMCHEMSHSRPTAMLVEPISMADRYQGKPAAISTRGRTTAAGATDSIAPSSQKRGIPQDTTLAFLHFLHPYLYRGPRGVAVICLPIREE